MPKSEVVYSCGSSAFMVATNMIRPTKTPSMLIIPNAKHIDVERGAPIPPQMGGNQSKKIAVLGLDNAGKTTLLRQLCKDSPQITFPTLGFQEKQVTIQNTQLAVVDVGGARSLRSSWPSFLLQASGLVFVIDSVDRRRTQEAALELEVLLQDLTKRKQQKMPVLVLANKCDVKTAQTEAEINQQLGLSGFAFQSVSIQRISALNGEGVDEAMKWLVGKLK